MQSVLKPMLATQGDVVPEGPEWILEPKFDGWRLIVHRDSTGTVRVYGGRNNADYTGHLPYLESALDWLPSDTVVDGELISTGTDHGSVGSIMRAAGPHSPTRNSPALQYVMFDVLRLAGKDVREQTWYDRRAMLAGIYTVRPSLELGCQLVRLVPHGPSSPALHQQMLDLGMEGSVCKRVDSRYINDRSQSWVKIKFERTDEATVIGFKPGKGSRASTIGALEVVMTENGARTTVGTGFSDALLDEINANRADWLGTVIEVKHNGLNKSGVPSNPVFARRRDDLAPAPVKAKKAPTGVDKGRRPRNYTSMKPEKLLRSIAELRAGEGEAVEKAVDVAVDLERAVAAAEAQGLEVAA